MAGDLALLQEVLRALARRLRVLVSERPEEARVEGEGIEKHEAMVEAEATAPVAEAATPTSAGEALAAAALGQTLPEGSEPRRTDYLHFRNHCRSCHASTSNDMAAMSKTTTHGGRRLMKRPITPPNRPPAAV